MLVVTARVVEREGRLERLPLREPRPIGREHEALAVEAAVVPRAAGGIGVHGRLRRGALEALPVARKHVDGLDSRAGAVREVEHERGGVVALVVRVGPELPACGGRQQTRGEQSEQAEGSPHGGLRPPRHGNRGGWGENTPHPPRGRHPEPARLFCWDLTAWREDRQVGCAPEARPPPEDARSSDDGEGGETPAEATPGDQPPSPGVGLLEGADLRTRGVRSWGRARRGPRLAPCDLYLRPRLARSLGGHDMPFTERPWGWPRSVRAGGMGHGDLGLLR